MQRAFPRTSLLPQFPRLQNHDYPSGRVYEMPWLELYPSITTVLKGLYDGPDMPAEVLKAAAIRGEKVHHLCEDYIEGEVVDPRRNGFNVEGLFRSVAAELDSHLTAVHAQEVTLYTKRLRMAGRCDLIADWDGVPSIVDFKTSATDKYESGIESYWLQTAGYSLMLQEMIGLVCAQLVVIVATEGDDRCKVFKRLRTSELTQKLAWVRAEYERKNECSG